MNIFELKQFEKNKILSEKFEVSEKTIKNYKSLKNPSYYPATGKHHLYKAMLDYVHLNVADIEILEDGTEVEEHNTNLDLLLAHINSLKDNVKLQNNSELTKDVQEAVRKSINNSLDTLDNILKEIR